MLGRDFYSFHLSDRTYERAEFGRFAIALPVKQFAIMVLGVLALTLLTGSRCAERDAQQKHSGYRVACWRFLFLASLLQLTFALV
jgi:hypothetical protein